ncbi:MAG: AAA family ATPase [Pyrinomonadaceae bacterium MAG19_C2-C3]|nr:AAA family ATPase [Pyrinomonadaceae bacterium MAG19_C2-C3]
MSENRKVEIRKLPTGVQKLDDVLGGGLPEYSFNLIVGEPGSGKTTLTHQIMFANATAERPALYFTILGEPTVKMLRYQQQFGFFESEQVGKIIHYVNLSEETLTGDLSVVLERIEAEVERRAPGIVVVDSFRSLVRAVAAVQDSPDAKTGVMDLQTFMQHLATRLTGWQATTFLVGEYGEEEMQSNPVATIADGVIQMTQSIDRNSMVRKLRVAKVRGQSPQPGYHTIRITGDGVQIFPRLIKPIEEQELPPEFISMGSRDLDEMMGGGTIRGNSMIVAGPSGTGKTALCTQFINEGVRRGEPAVLALFEEPKEKYLSNAESLGFKFREMIERGLLEVVFIRPLDLSVDETLYAIQTAVDKIEARRVVIDSISGLEAALAPTFKEDYKDSLYRLIGALTGVGITILMSVEVAENYNELTFTPHAISYLTNDIILQRYVEIDGQLRRMMTVIKTRGRAHSSELRAYNITKGGIVIGETLRQYRGLITAVPVLREDAVPLVTDGLTGGEAAVLLVIKEASEVPLKELTARTGMKRAELTRALARLVALDYAKKTTKKGETIYRFTNGL